MINKDEFKNVITSTELRNKLNEVMNKVQYTKEAYLVERHGKGSVLMIPCENVLLLSDRDRDQFLAALEHPPKASKALKKAMTTFKKQHG